MSEENLCCEWAKGDSLLIDYHDNEWCRPNHDDRYLFEMLCLEGASTGLSWKTIVHKRQEYKKVFFDFDIKKCAEMTDEYLEKQLENPGLIRNKNKIYSVRKNAIAVLKIQKEFGSFDSYVWSFTNGKQIVGNYKTSQEIPASSDISVKMSKDMKKRGIVYVGNVITYSFMQAVGIVNDHIVGCGFRELCFEE